MGRPTAIAAVLLALHSPAAIAAPVVRLAAENDNFNFWQPPDERPDAGYTHGTELEVGVTPRDESTCEMAWPDPHASTRLRLRTAARGMLPAPRYGWRGWEGRTDAALRTHG